MTDVASLRTTTDPFRTRVRGAVRRMLIKLTTKALWQLAGHKIDGTEEVIKAEPFSGIGIAARPPASGKPEAIVAMLNDAEAPVIIAIRDEKTRAAVAGALKLGETMVHTDKLVVHLTAEEIIELRKVGGVAGFVALLSDLSRLKVALVSWVPTGTLADGTALKTILTAFFAGTGAFAGQGTWPTGSTVVKVQ